MSETRSPPPVDQAEYWNTRGGETWVELQDLLDNMLAPLAGVLLDRAFPGEDRQVLDVGCGAGATTLAMARRLGPQGSCLGVDISTPLVAAAQARAQREGVRNARFLCADAGAAELEPNRFDALISRFGVMFFEDPEAAFRNLRKAMKPGGRLTFLAWRSPAENPMFSRPAVAAAPFLPPLPPPDPNAPGQFAFADPAKVEGILARSGWRDVAVERSDTPQSVPLADLQEIQRRMGPIGAARQGLDEATQARIDAAVREALAPFIDGDTARFSAACWLVTATA